LLTGEGREHHGEIMREATRLAEAGQLKPRLDARQFNLESVTRAHEALADGSARGKLVIEISNA
jgi:NADPH2:quinone reductase